MVRPPLDEPPPLCSLRGGPVPARAGKIRIGTASWTEATLIESGAFYPPGVASPAARLRYYARHFPVVEVDATYYALPSVRNTLAWSERTPEGFSFGVKAFAPFTTHALSPRRLPRDLFGVLPQELRDRENLYPRQLPPGLLEELWQRFRVALEPLRAAGKLGYVLFQMPRWFAASRSRFAYLEECRDRLPGFRIAVEFRDPTWLAPARRKATLGFLRSAGLVYVAVDEPQGTRASVPPVAEVTNPELAVVRFHGRRRATWDRPGVGTTERFRYLYREEELREWVGRLRELADRAREVYVLMNNCYRHYAVQNAKDLARLLS